jgi:periplasmic copper chaperone A
VNARLIAVFVAGVVFAMPAFSKDPVAGGPWKLGDITVEKAWARIVLGGAGTGAVYLTISNKSGGDDLLLAVDSQAARTTSVHRSVTKDGIARMEPMPFGLPMPHDSEVVMAPGGTHIMLTGLTGAAKPGDLLPVTMVFREAGSLDFEVPVFPLSAGEPKVKHSGHKVN